MISNRASASSHCGSWGNQNRMRSAPAIASNATTPTQKYQYIQPVTNPASSPIAAMFTTATVSPAATDARTSLTSCRQSASPSWKPRCGWPEM